MICNTDFLDCLFKRLNDGTTGKTFIKTIMTDSREKCEHALFVPIVGENFDGHDFLIQAIENGAVATLWQKSRPLPKKIPINFMIYQVEDTIAALQKLAHKYRLHVNPKVIAITGSNGKTTTKDMVIAILQTTYVTHGTKGNFNNAIGLPLTILSMPQNTEMLVVEMGMDHFGEIALLTHIAQPDIAIITNIGESHIEFLGSREGIAKAKLEVLEGLKKTGLLFIDGDEPLLMKDRHHFKKIPCGFTNDEGYHISAVDMYNMTTVFTLNRENVYTIPLLGEHHAKNATLAIAVAEHLEMENEKIKQALKTLDRTGMRFEVLTGQQGVTIINDAYNASASSMIAAINVVKKMDPYSCKILVLGDILELGDHAERLHLSVAKEISEPIHLVFTYGEKSKLIYENIRQREPSIKTKHFQNKQLLVDELKEYFNRDTIILFKASRGLAFEQMIEQCL